MNGSSPRRTLSPCPHRNATRSAAEQGAGTGAAHSDSDQRESLSLGGSNRRLSPLGQLPVRSHHPAQVGMLCGNLNRSSGSYARLTLIRRRRFAP